MVCLSPETLRVSKRTPDSSKNHAHGTVNRERFSPCQTSRSRLQHLPGDVLQPRLPASSLSSLGWYSTMYPATALAATVKGEARYICPGPLRPGKFRFCALMTTWSGRVETPGPALMQAPQLGSRTCAPAF